MVSAIAEGSVARWWKNGDGGAPAERPALQETLAMELELLLELLDTAAPRPALRRLVLR